jgi:hypothetical protein
LGGRKTLISIDKIVIFGVPSATLSTGASLGACDLLILSAVVAGKLQRASANKYRRGPSATRHKAAVSNKSAKRFAQDDGFVVGVIHGWLGNETRKIEKDTSSG